MDYYKNVRPLRCPPKDPIQCEELASILLGYLDDRHLDALEEHERFRNFADLFPGASVREVATFFG